VVAVLRGEGPGDQAGRGEAAGDDARRRGCEQRRAGALQHVTVLRPDNLTFEELRRHYIDFEGALFADFFVERAVLFHRVGLDHEGFFDREVREALGRQHAPGRGALRALVGDRLGRGLGRGGLRGGEGFELVEREEQLGALEGFG